MMITQNTINDTLQFSLCNPELMQERKIPSFADNHTSALTNCPSERRVALLEQAVNVMAKKTSKAVHNQQKQMLVLVKAIDIDTS